MNGSFHFMNGNFSTVTGIVIRIYSWILLGRCKPQLHCERVNMVGDALLNTNSRQRQIYFLLFITQKVSKRVLIFNVPACAPAYLKKIFPCRCICFASLLKPFHIAKPIRLRKPLLEIFLHSTAKIGFAFGCQ